MSHLQPRPQQLRPLPLQPQVSFFKHKCQSNRKAEFNQKFYVKPQQLLLPQQPRPQLLRLLPQPLLRQQLPQRQIATPATQIHVQMEEHAWQLDPTHTYAPVHLYTLELVAPLL